MTSILNKLAAAFSALGLGALAADLTGMADVPDSAGAQVVYVLAILGGLAWRTLPDQDDTPGPDVLQAGGKMDFRAWLRNIVSALRPASTGAGSMCLLILLTGCGGAQTPTDLLKWSSRTCMPAESDNCLVIQGAGSQIRVLQKPDVSMSSELWAAFPGVTARGAATLDPVTNQVEAEGCVAVLLWEECASTE
jgi:hypothetical protein